MMTRDELVEMLKIAPCMVRFVKVNGENRDMKATLNSNYIPNNQTEEDGIKESTMKFNPDVIRCFDPDKREWRSFRVTSAYDVYTLSQE